MMMYDMMEMLECIIYNMVYITNNYMYMYEMVVISEIYNQHHRNHHVYNNHPHNIHQDHH